MSDVAIVMMCPRHPTFQGRRDPRTECPTCWTLRVLVRDDRIDHRAICTTNVTVGKRAS